MGAGSPAPRGTGTAGRALWRSVLSAYELAEHERAVLGQAVKVADRISALDEIVDGEGVMHDDPKRGMVPHPALVEARQQRLVLARLLTALRLSDETDHRPQRRGMRGFYGPRRVVAGGGAAS